MNEYVYRNKLYAYEFIKKELPELKVIKGDATYLIWVDISKIEKDSVKFKDFLMKEVFLQVSDGLEYGENGKSYVRINLATSKSNVIEGLNRLKKGVKIYENIISR